MTNEFLHQLPTEDQTISDMLLTKAQTIKVNPQFQADLETRLKEAHPENKHPARGFRLKILPAIGWAVIAIASFLILNWAVRSLAPNIQPAANGTPNPNATPDTNITTGNLCTGKLAVVHDFSVFISNDEKSSFIELDEDKNIDELRSFALSPDGSKLAIVGNIRGTGNLYLTDAAGTYLQPVLSESQLGYLMGVAWSHDGNHLLTWNIENNTRLYLVNVDGTGLTAIDLPLQFFETPQFAPDDESILFYGADATTDGLFRATIDGSQVDLVSELVKSENSFAWSPDGLRLAYIEQTSDSAKPRIVISSENDESETITYPIQAGTGISTQDPGNLSWSPNGKDFVLEFRGTPNILNFRFAENINLWVDAHVSATSPDGKCLAYIRNNQVYLLNVDAAASSTAFTPEVLLADLPVGRGSTNFQLDNLIWMPEGTLALEIPSKIIPSPTPSGQAFDWRGMKLYLDAPLPVEPTSANIFQFQSEKPATQDSARALASQFGMNGEMYETPSLTGDGKSDFIIVDGNQRLLVGSNLFFSYFPDYTRWIAGSTNAPLPEQTSAEGMIDAFLNTHGFDFAYKMIPSEFFSGYYAAPLTPDGFPIRNEHFAVSGLLFRFDSDGIIVVEANLADYTQLQSFGIISAEAAFQKVLDPNTMHGIREGMHSAIKPAETWNRPRPENQTITVWGWISSLKSLEGGSPLVTFDGYRAIGNIADIPEATPNTYVEATGQFQTVDGISTFNVESWQVYNGYEEGLLGHIQRDGERVTLTTIEGNTFTLPDVPADLPLPLENAFVLGVAQGDVYEWKSIDTRMQGGGGGGGGGGGSGFYLPNLTGTPVPLPTPQAPKATGSGTPEQSLIGQRIEGERGALTVTIVKQRDGSQRVEYNFQIIEAERYLYIKLGGADLDRLQEYNNHPLRVWGTVTDVAAAFGAEIPVLEVERYEVLYPEQQFQILKGTQSIFEDQGRSITLFTTEDGQTYAQADAFAGVIGNEGDQVLLEALILPDENIVGYPVLQVVSASMAVNPKSGEPVEMEVTANKPYIIEEIDQPEPPAEMFATIEQVELVYFVPSQRYNTPEASTGPAYIQPVWRFEGHYWDGSEFEILIQALKDEFLLPEIENIEPPG